MNITDDMVRDAVEAFLANTGQAHKVTDLQRELATTCMRPALEAALSAQPVTISTGTAKESNGRVTHMTIVRRGDARIEDGHTSYLGRAKFNTARWKHVLLGHPEPDILAFDTDTRSGTDSPQPAMDVIRLPLLAGPSHLGLYQGPSDCPELQLNGTTVAVFPAGSWAEVCDALDGITGSQSAAVPEWLPDVIRALDDVATDFRANGRDEARFQRLISRIKSAAPSPGGQS